MKKISVSIPEDFLHGDIQPSKSIKRMVRLGLLQKKIGISLGKLTLSVINEAIAQAQEGPSFALLTPGQRMIAFSYREGFEGSGLITVWVEVCPLVYAHASNGWLDKVLRNIAEKIGLTCFNATWSNGWIIPVYLPEPLISVTGIPPNPRIPSFFLRSEIEKGIQDQLAELL